MVRELGQMGLRIGGVEILQRVSNLMVKLRPPGAGERVVRGVPDEGMLEQDSTGGAGYRSDDTSAHGLVEDAEELIATAAAHSFEHLEVKFTTEHGGKREHVEARRGEVTKPATDHFADSLRDGELLDRAGLEAALLDEQAHHFADEERIALGLGLNRIDERLGRSTAGRGLDVLRDGRLGQTLQGDAVGHRLASQLGQRARERVAQRWVHVAVGGNHEEPAVGELPCEKPEQQERRLVGRVHVVQNQHEWTPLRRRP